ncbi:alpha/beta hydrolase [Nocardia miyunensis]|uniref:alpha/beta hydrolase n=1 Tax=Nocardia miyunensis TaxID=282684 RepID=UPI0008336D9A|nr:alpha/beta hydrolase [Nocardia miyunensis]
MTDWRTRVDPELLVLAEGISYIDLSVPGFRESSLAGAAEQAALVDEAGVVVRDERIGSGVDSLVPVRIYRPAEQAPDPRPAILHMHGGGFVSGGLDTGHARLVELSREVGAVVVSVDYRLAPENRYPGALEDCEIAYRWLSEHAGDLGVDPERIALHGISAGGGLAAALALRARELPVPPPRLQVLSMAVLDDRQGTPSAREFVDTPVWHKGNAAYAWASYLGPDRVGAAGVDVLAAPGRATAEQVSGTCPAHVCVLELDPTRDEGIAYAQTLLAAGVSVELRLIRGAFHAFASLARQTSIAQRHDAEEVRVLRDALLR